jgi:hypothetical protein
MDVLGTSRRRAAIVMVAASVSVLGVVEPASARQPGPDPAADWGTVVSNGGCAQSDAWIASLRGLGGNVDTRLFESHSPPTPAAPQARNGGKDLVNLTMPSLFGLQIGLGAGSALYTRALANKVPAGAGAPDTTPSFCTAYAEAGGASIDLGLPYLSNPGGGTQLSPVGVHLEGVSVDATATPGKPVVLNGSAVRGYLSSLGSPVITIPPQSVNAGLRIPPDRSQPVLALATTNEQVTTDSSGRPTLDQAGHYAFDPTASSGYVNAVHISLLGTNGADLVVGHAAVLTGFPETGVVGSPVSRVR